MRWICASCVISPSLRVARRVFVTPWASRACGEDLCLAQELLDAGRSEFAWVLSRGGRGKSNGAEHREQAERAAVGVVEHSRPRGHAKTPALHSTPVALLRGGGPRCLPADHFVPGHFALFVNGHLGHDGRERAFGAADADVLGASFGDAVDEGLD